LEEAIADISAMSKHLLEGPHQEVLRNAGRNAYMVDGERHRGIDPARSEVSGFGWYHELVRRIDQKFGELEIFKGPVGVAAMLALPLLIFWILLSWIGGWHGIQTFLLAIVILLYCLGPEDLDDQVRALIAAIRVGNDVEANRLAQAIGRSVEPVPAETRGQFYHHISCRAGDLWTTSLLPTDPQLGLWALWVTGMLSTSPQATHALTGSQPPTNCRRALFFWSDKVELGAMPLSSTS
jgi:hypothetical protein